MRLGVLALAASLTTLPLASSYARPDLSNLEIAPNAQSFTLENGMEVVVIPDHRAPVVTHMVWYRVGAADEPPGKSGIAHYLEHLMFKGTANHPAGAFSDAVAAVGGRENAFTSLDYTGYFQQVAREHLGDMMAFEADRMANLVLTPEVAEPELRVVLEERRSRVDNDPGAQLGETLSATVFANHPYGIPIIGWPDEVASLDHEDAIAFYREHYAPENAILVVAGDVTAEEVRALAAETYGKVPARGAARMRDRPDAPRLVGRQTVEFADQRVNQPNVQQVWIVPSYNTAEDGVAEALDIMSEILGGGSTSRLYGALVRDGGPAASAGAYYQSSALDDTRFVVWGLPKDGVALAELEKGFEEVIARLAEEGPTEEELARAKTSVVSSAVFAQDSQSTLARIFGIALATGSTVEDVRTWPSRISAVTAEDVKEVARRFLVDQRFVTARLLPGEG